MVIQIKQKVIPKEDAVFWLDKNGCWRNAHGKFEHKKIIDYFHSCIQRDQYGYFLSQENGKLREKVYFPYEDQALFVFDVALKDKITLILNTKKKIFLNPDNLFIRDDNLYMRIGDETIKFVEHALRKIVSTLEDEDGRYYFCYKETRHRIPVLENSSRVSSVQKYCKKKESRT